MTSQPTYEAQDPKPVLKPDALYLGDNGRCFCGRHAGCSALYSGRDLSGQKVLRITPAMCARMGEDPTLIRCETCACDARRAIAGEVQS